VLNRYLGYWTPTGDADAAVAKGTPHRFYVEMMGGAARIMAKGRELHEAGRYLEATEILNKLVLAEPDNQPAKDLLADVYGADRLPKESRVCATASCRGIRAASRHARGCPAKSSGPDTIRGMTTELWLNFLGISLTATSRRRDGCHQSRDAGQWRAVRGGAEQFDADQHQGPAGHGPGPDHHARPQRPRKP